MKKYNKLLSVAVATAMGMSVNVNAQDQEEEDYIEEVTVSGIRSSLKKSTDIKRDSIGVVDAISAEDIGKFPDTNLAESLQRITGVSINRDLGEGSTVTVRGWGADFNLVTLNGRMMPTASLGDGASAPSSRSFDFANLASEGISGVEVYKTGRASIPTGGIGATLNIKTTKPLEAPGFKATVGAKGVFDQSQNDSTDLTPEISGLFSNTFADDTFGVAVSASYQQRKASVNSANVGWRDAYLGSSDFDGEWGRLPAANEWNWQHPLLEGYGDGNRPGDTDVYAVPQNASYDLVDIDRERVNGQLVLQYAPSERLTGTLDYTYSQNQIEARNSNVGIWFNHAAVVSAWTDGPVAGPLFYTEFLGNSDLSYSGSLTANKSENKSLGFNLDFAATDRLSLELDYHNSTAESGPDNDYGTNMSVGTAVFGIDTQTINFENDLPVISITNTAGVDPEDPAQRFATGSAFRNALQKSEIDQIQLKGRYEVDPDIFISGKFVDSIDFGVSRVENNVQSAFGVLQTDSWGGLGTAADIPDDIFTFETLPDKFDGISGANDPAMLQGFYGFDFERMVDLLESQFGICSNSWSGNNIDDTCLAQYTTNRSFEETTDSAYLQFNNEFELNGRPAHMVAGVRYERTDVVSKGEVPLPVGTSWPGINEFNLIYDDPAATLVTSFEGDYDHVLPSLDFDMQLSDKTILRSSWSKTISRQTYDKLQGGTEAAQLFRTDGGSASLGDPGLLPLESKNFDISLEWYYGDDGLSYVSLGYFNKQVENFSTNLSFDLSASELDFPVLTHPLFGPRADAARAALGATAGLDEIQAYIVDPANGFAGVEVLPGPDGTLGTADDVRIAQGLPEDQELIFAVTRPILDTETSEVDGFEFALQHNFGDTGFGAIFNYTYVNGGSDVTYDNTLPYNVEQFTLVGLSDSANIVAFYDKNNIQARLAYNWRDTFLAGNGPNPFYREEYSQIDGNISYELNDNWTFSLEGINLTGEDARGHRRSENAAFFAIPGEPRYMIGARYTY